jgi:hypothetical protein
LDIFAQHAKSREGKAQVELAQMSYMLPRLRGWGDLLHVRLVELVDAVLVKQRLKLIAAESMTRWRSCAERLER